MFGIFIGHHPKWQKTHQNMDYLEVWPTFTVADQWTISRLATMLLHQPGPQLKLPSSRKKSIHAISA